MDLKAKLALHHRKKPEQSVAKEGNHDNRLQKAVLQVPEGTETVDMVLPAESLNMSELPAGDDHRGSGENHLCMEKDTEVIRDTIYEPVYAGEQLTSLLPARRVQSELGEYLLAEYRYPLTHFHGRFYLGALQNESLSALCGVLKDQGLLCPTALQNLVFMDTETTGLAGGTGTFAFLIGLGYFTDNEFVLRQYMMEDYHQELAVLDVVYREIQDHSHLVTFNGKTFDWPLLESRLIYHRMRERFCPFHVDLLHPARRYYKSRLENCRLGSLEDEVLGFSRTADISGAEVPALFFRYLEERDGRIIQPVFQHNHWDILTLVTLLTHLVQAYLLPDEVLAEPEDLFSAGKIHEDLGESDRAVCCYLLALEHAKKGPLHQEILTRLSFLYKRLGRMDEACRIWERFIQSKNNLRLFPYLEMAKYLEHQRKDLNKALEVTRLARELLLAQRRLYSGGKFREMQQELDHRESRLLKKLNQTGETGFPLALEE